MSVETLYIKGLCLVETLYIKNLYLSTYIKMEILENIFEYDNDNKMHVVFHENEPWFNATDVCKILDYHNTTQTLDSNVNKKYVKKLEDLFLEYKKYSNAQPHSLFINEFGLYMLIFRSRKEEAIKFTEWIAEKVLPEIRNKGNYKIDEKSNKTRIKINEELDKYKKLVEEKDMMIVKLMNNQKKKT